MAFWRGVAGFFAVGVVLGVGGYFFMRDTYVLPTQLQPQPPIPLLRAANSPPAPVNVGSQLYAPAKTREWDTEAGVRIAMGGLSFELPEMWHGEMYGHRDGQFMRAFKPSPREDHPITISLSCPPAGKGLEAATRLSTEDRTFVRDGRTYTASLQKWTASENNPWYFLFVDSLATATSTGINCLAHGSADDDSTAALRMMFETLDSDEVYYNPLFGFTLSYGSSSPWLQVTTNNATPITYSPTGGGPSLEVRMYTDVSAFNATMYDPGQNARDDEEYEPLTYAPTSREWVVSHASETPLCPTEAHTTQGVPYYTVSSGHHAGDYYNVYVTDSGIIAVMGGYAPRDGVWKPEEVTFDHPETVQSVHCRAEKIAR